MWALSAQTFPLEKAACDRCCSQLQRPWIMPRCLSSGDTQGSEEILYGLALRFPWFASHSRENTFLKYRRVFAFCWVCPPQVFVSGASTFWTLTSLGIWGWQSLEGMWREQRGLKAPQKLGLGGICWWDTPGAQLGARVPLWNRCGSLPSPSNGDIRTQQRLDRKCGDFV